SGNVQINAPGGDIYQTEGFRLPTEAEQEYLLTDRGRSSTGYFSGVDENNLKDHAWYDSNSGRKTHPVAQLAPQMIDGKDFHDLHGNVREWGSDWYNDNALKGGTDPRGPAEGSRGPSSIRVIRGGSWLNLMQLLRSSFRSAGAANGRNSDL